MIFELIYLFFASWKAVSGTGFVWGVDLFELGVLCCQFFDKRGLVFEALEVLKRESHE